VTVRAKERENVRLSDFERGQSVDARLAGASVTKTATLLRVSGATVSKVMSACTNHGKTSANTNSGRKSTLTERDRCSISTVSKTTTAGQVTG
jgi:transposase